MKYAPDNGPIWQTWFNGGALVAGRRAHSRVTVEPGYQLHSASTAGGYTKCPVRWFQRADNSQTEIEIPGLRTVETSYSVDQDTGECTITLTNQFLDPDYSNWSDANGDFGQPGYLTPDRGSATNRWGFEPNEWAGVLTRNALIRTYQGYGGHDLTIEDAITAGNLVLTGVWLVDEPVIATGQSFVLRCRGMGKLLVDQIIYPPLVPPGYYPLSYRRYFKNENYNPKVVYGHLAVDPKYRVLTIQTDPTDGIGYWLCGTDGGVFTYGQIQFWGSLGDAITPTNTPGNYPNEGITSMASTYSGNGYWLVNSAGQVYTFGDAAYHGGLVQPGAPDDPIICIERSGPSDGYWLCTDKGGITAFGAAVHYGDLPPGLGSHLIVDMATTSTGHGYWLVADNGAVYAYGDAGYHGGENTVTLAAPITAIAPTPSNNGYYLVGKDGGVFTHGDAVFRGSIVDLGWPVDMYGNETQAGNNHIRSLTPQFLADDVGCAIACDAFPSGTTVTGFVSPTEIVVSNNATSTHTNNSDGGVFLQVFRIVELNDPVADMIVAADNSGYWLAAEDGGVFAFNVPFMGSLPGQFDYTWRTAGNYTDYTDIIRDLALWSGFHLYDDGAHAYVHGNLETTGVYAGSDTNLDDEIDATVFDRKPVIDPMHTIKEQVGYLLYVGDEGELHFHEPNFWQSGNYLRDSTHTDFVPVIDERVQLTRYQVSQPDTDLRSEIIISSNDPLPDFGTPVAGTVTASYTPDTASELRGMVKPAQWLNLLDVSEAEMGIMARLIALHIYFKSRLGQLSMLANPMIQINDQVQILERETFEINTHYVRSIHTTHDIKEGAFESDVTTNLLSPPGTWQVVRPSDTPTGSIIARRV